MHTKLNFLFHFTLDVVHSQRELVDLVSLNSDILSAVYLTMFYSFIFSQSLKVSEATARILVGN